MTLEFLPIHLNSLIHLWSKWHFFLGFLKKGGGGGGGTEGVDSPEPDSSIRSAHCSVATQQTKN